VASTVGGSTTAVGLTALAVFLGLSTESALVAVMKSPIRLLFSALCNCATYIFPSSVLEKGQP